MSQSALITKTRKQLRDIAGEMNAALFPLSSLPSKSYQQQLAHALSAINLARCILRDTNDVKDVKETV